MRRFLIITLALVTLLSLVSCGASADETTDTTPTETQPTDVDTSGVRIDPVETDAPESSDETTASAETEEVLADEFISVNETVYVYGTDVLNVRAEPSKDSAKMGEMKEGEQVTRIGYNSSWSKISYYGNTYYASSDYLTTRAPLDFSDKTDTVYIIAEGTLNLRKKPAANSDIVAFLPYGTELSRTGIATTEDDAGIIWSRLLYNGEVCYASSSFLDTEKPSLSDTDDDFKTVNEIVYVARKNGNVTVLSLNVRALPSLSSNSLAVLEPDTMLTRIGIAKEADADGIIWSMVVYNGKTGYVSSSYITTEVPTDEVAEQ